MGRWRNFENQQKWFDDGDIISTMDYKINNYFPKIGLIMVNDTFYFNHGLYIYNQILIVNNFHDVSWDCKWLVDHFLWIIDVFRGQWLDFTTCMKIS